MHIRYGYRIELVCPDDAEIVTLLDIHPSRRGDITEPEWRSAAGLVKGHAIELAEPELDLFGNIRRRLRVPAGGAVLAAQGILFDPGFGADRHEASAEPEARAEAMRFLKPSRWCDVEQVAARVGTLADPADGEPAAVRTLCDFVRRAVRLRPESEGGRRSSAAVLERGSGDGRDLVHIAISLCRALGLPARYCMGYALTDGRSAVRGFAPWFEVWIAGGWQAFDPAAPASPLDHASAGGRILIGTGRDSSDVDFIQTSDPCEVNVAEILTQEVTGSRFPATAAERWRHHAQRMSLAQG